MTNSDRSPTANRRIILAKGALLGAGALGATVGAAAPASAETDRYARGLAALRRISGERGTEVIESLRDIAPDLGRYIVEFAFGDIYYRPWLSPPRRQLVTVGALTAFGDTASPLRVHLGAALNVGLSRAQVIEALIDGATELGQLVVRARHGRPLVRVAGGDPSGRGSAAG